MGTSMILDLVLAGLILITVIKHTIRGFMKSVLSLARLIISVVLAWILRTPVSAFISRTFLSAPITNFVRNSLNSSQMGEDKMVNFRQMYEDFPTFYNNLLSKFGLDMDGLHNGFSDFDNATGETIDALSENIGSAISQMASTAIAVFAVFIIAFIVSTIIIHILNGLTSIHLVNVLNRLLGFTFGALIGFFVVSVACFALDIASTYFPGVINREMLEGSMIFGLYTKLNLISIIGRVFVAR